MLKLSARMFCILLLAPTAHADSTEPFQSLYPEFLKTEITPAYWQHESPISPATYDAGHGDFLSEFFSPSGKQVRLVVKGPVTTTEYDVPPIGNGQTAYDYLNSALYDASGDPRTATYIKFPKSTYNIEFPLNSNCSGHPQPFCGADAKRSVCIGQPVLGRGAGSSGTHHQAD
jgi:hypothetical protein